MRHHFWAIPIATFVLPAAILSASAQSSGLLPDAGKEFKDCTDCPVMVVVPPGSYTMGAPDSETGHGPDEHPQHVDTITYKLGVGKFEVTRSEYEKFSDETKRPVVATDTCFTMDSGKWEATKDRNWRNPGFAQTPRDPVTCLSSDDARAYTQWLSAKTGKKYRLLSEAEWEYAARAGTSTPWYWGTKPEDACTYANGADLTSQEKLPQFKEVVNCKDGHTFTAPVGSYKPNQFGLYDMLGNVWEILEDCSSNNYDGAPTDGSPLKNGDCTKWDMRGGAWKCVQTCDPAVSNAPQQILPSVAIRAANRDRSSDRTTSTGFRVARVD